MGKFLRIILCCESELVEDLKSKNCCRLQLDMQNLSKKWIRQGELVSGLYSISCELEE